MPPEMIHILVNMTSLVNVYLDTFESLHQLPESRHFPQGLRELRLFADAIEQDPMPILEKLPCLVVLLLQGVSRPHHGLLCPRVPSAARVGASSFLR